MLQVESSDEIWHLLSYNTVSELSVCSRAYIYIPSLTDRIPDMLLVLAP